MINTNTKDMKIKNLLLVAFIAIASIGFSQDENLSEDCKKFKSLYPTYEKNKMHRDAANFFMKAYNTCGVENINVKDWNNARIIYKNLYKAEKDETRKGELKDSVMWVYESGLKINKDPKWSINYATDMVNMKVKNTDGKIDTLYANSIHTIKEKLSTFQIYIYNKHLITKFNNATGESKEKARGFAIDEYLRLSEYIETAIKTNTAAGKVKKADKYKKVQDGLDNSFTQLAKDCDVLVPVLAKEIEKLPTAKEEKIKKVKGFITLLENRGCVESDLYGQFADTLIALEPTAAAYYAQGNFFLKRKNNKKAKDYYSKAVKMEADGENKNKYKLALANALYATKSYKAAFKMAKSVGGEQRGRALVICANSIAATANSCGDTTFDRKANYWLANDYMKKAAAAGAKASSSKYLSNAPTKAEVFDANKSMGASQSLPCWGENTTIR